MQNDLFEKWYSLSFPNSSLERNEGGSYFRRKTNFSLESFEAGQQSKQAEVDELQLRLSEDSRVLHNVIDIERRKCEELQKLIDDALKWCEKGCVLKAMEVLKGEETK